MTMADLLRSLSDEEFASYLVEIVYLANTNFTVAEMGSPEFYDEMYEQNLKMLKKEVPKEILWKSGVR